MSTGRVLAFAALAATVAGMMLVIAGVLVAGLFMPGVVMIGMGLVAFAAAAVIDGLGPA